MKLKHIFSIVAAVFSIAAVQAQVNLPKTTIAGSQFHYYEVQQGENIYSIANKLGITKDEIIKNNPEATDGIEEGMRLYFPIKEGATPTKTYTVQQGETLYGLAKRYGTTIDELIAANPGTENGLKAGQTIKIPSTSTASATNADDHVRDAFNRTNSQAPVVTTNQIAAPQVSDPVYHTLAAGESIYSIAKQHNATIEGILTSNPGLKPAEYVEGAQVKIVPNTALPFIYERNGIRLVDYEVQKGESFASIAKAKGITEQELKAANPGMKKAKKGSTIKLPTAYSERLTGEMATIALNDLKSYYEPRINGIYEALVNKSLGDQINIAMVLPFQLHKSDPPKQAYLYTDFYKGFLLAMDSAAHVTGKHISLKVYDTQHNLNVTDSILALPELKTMNMIIAPSEPKQLERINNFGRANGVGVLNCFTTKNEDYLENPYVYQVLTPTNEMTHNVMRWFDERFNGYHVIYLKSSEGSDNDIFSNIQTHIQRKGYSSSTIMADNSLSFGDISNQMNPGSKYVFIPSSGDQTLIKRYISSLKQVKNERFDCDISLIAYPEYVLYLKDYQTDLQDIDTYMFSRFFNAKGFRTRDLEAAYKANFSGEPLQGMPNMALLGYDTGMFLLKSLGVDGRIDEDTPLYKGIQTSFRFERVEDWRGNTNQAIEIVHFSTDHKITVNVR